MSTEKQLDQITLAYFRHKNWLKQAEEEDLQVAAKSYREIVNACTTEYMKKADLKSTDEAVAHMRARYQRMETKDETLRR